MDWKQVGRLVAPLAPVAGSILGGFLPIPGGSLIGQKFGELIAGAFGVAPTPQAVSDAVANANRDEAVAKINAATEAARIQIDGFVALERATLDAMVKNLGDVNATMRAEAASSEPFFYRAWRPVAGWLFDVVMGVFGALLSWAIGKTVAGSATPLAVLTDAWPVFAAYIGALALVNGVLIPSRTVEKKAAIENGAPMPNATPARVPPNVGSGGSRPGFAHGGPVVIPKPAGSKD